MWHQEIASPVDAPVIAQPSPFMIVVSPNPARDFTQAEFEVPAGGARVTGNVFDATGRRVRQLVDADLPAGQRRLLWDGCAQNGERATAGIYFVRIRAGASEGTAKIVRLD
jgi:flagellar hook assembly protein FlgD